MSEAQKKPQNVPWLADVAAKTYGELFLFLVEAFICGPRQHENLWWLFCIGNDYHHESDEMQTCNVNWELEAATSSI